MEHPKLNEDLENRLYNFKFDSALNFLEVNESEDQVEVIKNLALMYGNCGHLDGFVSYMIECTLKSIGVDYDSTFKV